MVAVASHLVGRCLLRVVLGFGGVSVVVFVLLLFVVGFVWWLFYLA